jgi:HK97 family phage prohead protease
MERRFLQNRADLAVRQRMTDDARQVRGYAAAYYDGSEETEFTLWEGVVERIIAGAFDRAVKEDDVRALFNHDPSEILGRRSAKNLTLGTDETGLWYRIDMADTARSHDLLTHIERGDITGSSFAFDVTDETWRKQDGVHIRELRGVRLYDVGPVTFPAYESTTAEAKAADRTVRAAKHAFRRWQAREAADKLGKMEEAFGRLNGQFDDLLRRG